MALFVCLFNLGFEVFGCLPLIHGGLYSNLQFKEKRDETSLTCNASLPVTDLLVAEFRALNFEFFGIFGIWFVCFIWGLESLAVLFTYKGVCTVIPNLKKNETNLG